MNISLSKHVTGNLSGTICLPASKSISNRLLVLSFLSGNTLKLHNLSTAEDTLLMQRLLQKIADHKGGENEVKIDCADAGTVFRFLTAVLAITPGNWLITGSRRLQERPIDDLVSALQSLGANINMEEKDHQKYIHIQTASVKGGEVHVSADQSSQFVSALMLIAPFLENGLHIFIADQTVSFPYIRMTAHLLTQCGVHVTFDDDGNILISGNVAPEKTFNVEADWSSASYFYAMAAMAKQADLYFPGLTLSGLQGDSVLSDIFDTFGVKSKMDGEGIRIQKCMDPDDDQFYMDFMEVPDLAPTMAVLCAGLQMDAELSGLDTLALKESNRITAIQTELEKIHVKSEYDEEDASLLIHPVDSFPAAVSIQPHDDHRIAMAFAGLSLRMDVHIENAEVVQKSFPAFWEEFQKLQIKEN